MENEWREREPVDPKPGKKDKIDARKVMEDIQAGNYYKEKEPVVETHSSASRHNQGSAKKEKGPRADNNQPKGTKKAPKADKNKKAPKRPNLLVQVLNGDILARDFVVNNLTFIFFILLLLLLVVAKGYYGKQLTKDIDTLQTDVNASTAEYIENKAKLEESTARYRLVEALERKGLKEAVKPAKVIRLKRKGK
jgi:hypothetical protein